MLIYWRIITRAPGVSAGADRSNLPGQFSRLAAAYQSSARRSRADRRTCNHPMEQTSINFTRRLEITTRVNAQEAQGASKLFTLMCRRSPRGNGVSCNNAAREVPLSLSLSPIRSGRFTSDTRQDPAPSNRTVRGVVEASALIYRRI